MRSPRSAPRRRALPAAAAAALATVALAAPSPAQTGSPWSYEQDIHLTYEFDDNVREEVIDPVHAQVAKLSYLGDLRWAGGDQRLTFSYAGGFKRHMDVVADGETLDGKEREVEIASQFVHQGSAEYLRRLGRNLYVRGRGGVKTRTWTDGEFSLLNEDAFTRYSGEVGAILSLEPLEAQRPARLEVGARYSDIEFDNLDRFFGNWIVGGYVRLAKPFDESLEVRTVYSLDQVRYPGRGALEPGDQPQDILGVARPRQEDRIHELGAEVEWFGPVAIVAEYRFRYNDSNSFGFENFSHRMGIQVLRQLPWGMLAHGFVQGELRTFTEPVPRAAGGGSADIGEAEDNVLLLRLVKDITESYSVEARYARYRNESITLNDFYTKNIWAIGINIRP